MADYIGQLYQSICRITTRYEFTAPVLDEDLRGMERLIMDAAPSIQCSCQITPDGRRVAVVASRYSDGVVLYGREMFIYGLPGAPTLWARGAGGVYVELVS